MAKKLLNIILSLGVLALAVGESSFALSSAKFERVPPGEAELTQALIAKISADIKLKRDAHPKDHGCVDGIKVTVKSDLGSLQVGVFKNPGQQFDAILRSSHGASDPKASDVTPSGHGFALKILLPELLQSEVADIPGEEYFMDKKFYKTLDIISISDLHEFMVSTVADYPEFFKAAGLAAKFRGQVAAGALVPADFGSLAPQVEALQSALAAQTARPDDIAKLGFAIMNDAYFHLPLPGQLPFPATARVRATEAALSKTISAAMTYDVLAQNYQSWVPSLLGPEQAVKYQFRPVACADSAPVPVQGQALLDSLNVATDPNRLKVALKARLAASDNCFELALHVLEAGSEDLVEHAEKAWPGRDRPDAYRAVATVRIPQKRVGAELLADETCEALSFNPAHSPLDHKGIGGIQRSRALIYAAIETVRNKQVRAAKEENRAR